MQRPFRTIFEKTYPEHTMELDVSFHSLLTEEETDLLKCTVDKLVDLAQWGGFSGDAVSPMASGMTLDRTSWMPNQVTWRFSDVKLDAKTVCVFLNCLHSYHEEIKPLDAVMLSWNQVSELKNPLATQYPGRFSPLPFDLIIGDLEIQPFDIVVEFEDSQELSQVEKIADLMGVWVSAVNLGAYAIEGMSCSSSRVDFTDEWDHLSPGRIEWYIDALRCSEDSLNGLVGLLHKIHHLEAPLRRVEIGEPLDT